MKQYKKTKAENSLLTVPLESRTSMLNKELDRLKKGLKQSKPDKYISTSKKYLKAGNKLASIKSILSAGLVQNFSVDEVVALIYNNSTKVGFETISSLLFFSALEKANGLWLERYRHKNISNSIVRGNTIGRQITATAEENFKREEQKVLAPNFANTDELCSAIRRPDKHTIDSYDPTQKYMLLTTEYKKSKNNNFTPTIAVSFTYNLDLTNFEILNDTMNFIEKEQGHILTMLQPYISASQFCTLIKQDNWRYYE